MSLLLSGANDAIPYCGDTTERAARFATPNLNQRVQVGRALTRWTGTAWVMDAQPSSALLSPLDPAYGAAGDGTADDTTALQTLLTAAAVLGRAVVDGGGLTYKTTAPLTVTGNNITIGNANFVKAHTGDLFQWTGNYGAFHNVHLDAKVATSATYGTSGVGLHFATASTGFGFQWIGGGSDNIDIAIDINTDAAHTLHIGEASFVPYTTAIGSEPDLIYLRGDTTAAHRTFTGLFLNGNFRVNSALDTLIANTVCRTVVTDDNNAIMSLTGCVLANNNNAHTFKGTTLLIQGCRLSGSATLAVNSSGTWVGNMFTSGSLTDSSGGYLWAIHHRVESSALTTMLDGHLLRRGFAGILTPNATVKPGNAAVSTQTTATPTNRTIIFNSAITADRAVTLNTGSDYKDGDSYHIIRTAAATGAFNVNVGTGPLKALAAGTWCIVTYDGSTWFLTAYGAL